MSARALAECVTPDRLEAGAIYPDPSMLREVSRKIAASVIREAGRRNLGRRVSEESIDTLVSESMSYPEYLSYVAPA